MPSPQQKPKEKLTDRMSTAMKEELSAKSMEDILLDLADMKKTDIAAGIVQGAMDSDPASLKILQAIMERQGGMEKELPITDGQYKTIIEIAAGELGSLVL
jgi:hypothetical protein